MLQHKLVPTRANTIKNVCNKYINYKRYNMCGPKRLKQSVIAG